MALDLIQLSILGTVAGQFVENVQSWESTQDSGNDPVPSCKDMVDGWMNAIQVPWLNVLPDNYALIGLRARRTNNGGGNTYVRPIVNTFGNRAGGSDLAVAGPCLIFPVSLGGGVFNTGKQFMPGVSTLDVANGKFNQALLDTLTTLIQLMLDGFAGAAAGYILKIINRASGLGTSPSTGSTSLKPGIQNRRLRPSV